MSERVGKSRISDLYQAGSLKLLFPRTDAGFQGVFVNTAGGITGGDQFEIEATATQNAALTLTTQAAERAYKAQPNSTGRLRTKLHVARGATLNWLPQETILFDGASMSRSLDVDLDQDASFTFAEPLVFGREAMGETVSYGFFHDRVSITQNGAVVYKDAMRFEGDIHAQLQRPAVAKGAGALVSLVHISSRAEALLEPLRELLPKTAGASLLGENLLVLRALASDSFQLRKFLIPVLEKITGDDLPRPWKI